MKSLYKLASIMMILISSLHIFYGCDDDNNNNNTDVQTTYSINYNLNGGINDKDNPSTQNPEKDTTLQEPTKIGYKFDGWYLSENFEGENIIKIDKSNQKNVSVFAKWSLDNNFYGGLPLIQISTEDYVLPNNKTDYMNCSFDISNSTTEFNISMKENYGDKNSVGIRLRGNSTSGCDKKPYRIKFDKKQSFFGLTANKSWVLLADFFDQSAIRNYTALTLGNKMPSLNFTPSPNHVVLYLNNQYEGLYLLCEQIDEKEGRTNCEVDSIDTTDTSFPFLIEMDRNALSEGVTGKDNFQITNYYYPMEIKYPEFDERNIAENQEDVVFNYIKDYMTAVFTALQTNQPVMFQENMYQLSDLVDINSFIEYFLVNEIMFNLDSTWGSIYMYKTASGKLQMGPVWDFDWSCSNEFILPYNASYIECARTFCVCCHNTMFNSFLQFESNYQLVQTKWDSIKSNLLDTIEIIKNYKSTIKGIARLDAQKWYGENGAFQFDMQYDYVRLFLIDRYDFLDNAFDLSFSDFSAAIV